MTQPGIELSSSRPLVNTLPTSKLTITYIPISHTYIDTERKLFSFFKKFSFILNKPWIVTNIHTHIYIYIYIYTHTHKMCESPGNDTKLHLVVRLQFWSYGKYSIIAITPMFIMTESLSNYHGHIYGSNRWQLLVFDWYIRNNNWMQANDCYH